jgi:hypothetical protein
LRGHRKQQGVMRCPLPLDGCCARRRSPAKSPTASGASRGRQQTRAIRFLPDCGFPTALRRGSRMRSTPGSRPRSTAAAAPVPPRTRGAPRIWRCRSMSAPPARARQAGAAVARRWLGRMKRMRAHETTPPRAGRRCSHDGLRPRLYMSPAPGATARAILRPECAIQAADRAAAPVGGTPGGAGPRRRARSPVSGRPGRCSAAGRGDRHLAAGNDRGVGRGPVAAAATDARCGGRP